MKQINSPNGRTYEIPGGLRVPSVTSILSVISKPALVPWAAKQERTLVRAAAASLWYETFEDHYQTQAQYLAALDEKIGTQRAHQKLVDEASDIGSRIHDRIDRTLRSERGEGLVEDPPLEGAAGVGYAAWEQWRSTTTFVPTLTERIVYSQEFGYAGTLDWFGTLNGAPTLGDWKTSSAIYPEAKMQVAAYAMAMIEMGLADTGMNGCIVRIPKTIGKDDPCETVSISWIELCEHFCVFRSALDLYKWQAKQRLKLNKN